MAKKIRKKILSPLRAGVRCAIMYLKELLRRGVWGFAKDAAASIMRTKFCVYGYGEIMKLLHLADLHLGSEMSARLSVEKARLRREELCRAFDSAVEYAKTIGATAVLLAGDVFDGALPPARDKEFFYDVIRSAEELTFFYLKGNHDEAEEAEFLPNLKTFRADKWTTYDLGEGVTVSGIELTDTNGESYYEGLALDDRKKNIVMLHGQTADSRGAEKIHLRSLAGRGIDYLALGHIHSYGTGKIDARGTYAYSGCLEPRGFDELGEKGFVVIDTAVGVEHSFVERSARSVKREMLDVSGLAGIAQVLQKASELPIEKENMLRIVLTGEADFDTDGIESFLHARLKDRCFALSVKDETEKALHIEKYEGQVCVEWEFIKLVQANGTLSEKQKKEVISMGLKALKGERL